VPPSVPVPISLEVLISVKTSPRRCSANGNTASVFRASRMMPIQRRFEAYCFIVSMEGS
jgi:hypothetical protein